MKNLLLLIPLILTTSVANVPQEEVLSTLELPPFYNLPYQTLDTPYHGQHVGVQNFDLNGDGVEDVLFAAGRHWIDQSYALINLGPEYNDGRFLGVKFSEALPIGKPGSYYQIDVSSNTDKSDDAVTQHSTVLLVGGTCHVEKPNDLGSCKRGDNTPARVVHVAMNKETGCSIHNPDAKCELEFNEVWEHPNPRGDRNGGFATFNNEKMIALLGQGGIEIFQSVETVDTPSITEIERQRNLLHTSYSPVFHLSPPPKTDERSDYSRYAGFGAGHIPKLGGVVAAGRRTDYDLPQVHDDGNVIGINLLVHEDTSNSSQSFQSSVLSSKYSGEPYPGNKKYSLQSTNYAFDDLDGDGIDDILEATFLYSKQRVPGYPLPQRILFMYENGKVKDTLVLLEAGAPSTNGVGDENDAGRSVTTGQIFSDSTLPDVVFASAEGVVSVFANLGVDEATGKSRGFEMRYQLAMSKHKCQVRDIAVTKLAQDVHDSDKCWVGIVGAVTCGIDVMGRNHIFYIEGNGSVCK